MSTLSTSVRRPRDARLTIAGIAGFSIALALASQVAIPLPFTPVPITLQPLVVVLAGLMLGPAAGAASMVLYLAAGAAGLPVFPTRRARYRALFWTDGRVPHCVPGGGIRRWRFGAS